jgi:hypothetical protein
MEVAQSGTIYPRALIGWSHYPCASSSLKFRRLALAFLPLHSMSCCLPKTSLLRHIRRTLCSASPSFGGNDRCLKLSQRPPYGIMALIFNYCIKSLLEKQLQLIRHENGQVRCTSKYICVCVGGKLAILSVVQIRPAKCASII